MNKILLFLLFSSNTFAIDKVRPLKMEDPASGGTQTDYMPTSLKPSEDYVSTKGISLEDNSSRLIDLSAGGEIQWKDQVQTTYKTLNSIFSVARWLAIASHDGGASVGRWLAFASTNPSNNTPLVIPVAAKIKELTLACNSSSTVTVAVFKNAVSQTTISLAADLTNYVTGLSVALAAGDKVSAQVTVGSCTRPNLQVFIQND